MFYIFFFSSHCQFFTQPHSISVKLLFAGTWQCRVLVLNTSSLQSIHIAYHFPSCLIAATAFCPDLKPHVELPMQTPSCSCLKPDILPFPNNLLQPDSLANHPQDTDEESESLPSLQSGASTAPGKSLGSRPKFSDLTQARCSCVCLAGR